MSRLLVLTSGTEQAGAIAENLKAAGAAVAELTDSVLTVVMSSAAGPTIVNCGEVGPWVERMATFGDTVGIAMLTDGLDLDPAAVLGPAIDVVSRVPLHLPIAIGVPMAIDRTFTDWVSATLRRELGEIPIFTVDPRRPSDVPVLLATLLCMAHEMAEES